MDIANNIAANISIELGLRVAEECKVRVIVKNKISEALQARYDEKAAIFNDFYQKSSRRDSAWDSMEEICHIALAMDINLKLRLNPTDNPKLKNKLDECAEKFDQFLKNELR